jgi:hypothetical protein
MPATCRAARATSVCAPGDFRCPDGIRPDDVVHAAERLLAVRS